MNDKQKAENARRTAHNKARLAYFSARVNNPKAVASYVAALDGAK